MKGIHSLYLHIPFCERKCEYCDFTSIAGLRGQHEYMRALQREVAGLGELFPGTVLRTVFIGGGTPSLVEPCLVQQLMGAVTSSFALDRDAEVTMEANPSSTSRRRAEQWREAGVTRVSIGVQSLEPDILAFLGRVHNPERALGAVAEVRDAGFTSVNCDLIYAVPGLDDPRWRATLERVVAAGPTHVSCYELTVEPGTPLHRSVRLGRVVPFDGDAALRQHRIAVDTLAGAGLAQYEVSNFARPGLECRHNLAYWRNAHYLAAGVGAHGHVPAAAAPRLGIEAPPRAVAVRYWHGRGIAAYVTAIDAGRAAITGSEAVDGPTREVERVMLGLRLRDGVAVASPAAAAEAGALAAAGLLQVDAGRVRVTPRGENVLNSIALRLADAAA